MDEMPRVQALWALAAYRNALASIEDAEQGRVFCRHGLAHLLDVARIAHVLNLERGLGFEREVVYTASLLHDIGRAAEYATGEPHDEAGWRMAAEMLDALPAPLRFPPPTRASILAAVREHRGGDDGGDGASGLAALLREADTRSRPCYACRARQACYWPDARKNLSLGI